jgi:ComF family protein
MSYLDDLIGLIYPRICLGCGNPLWKNERVICTFCDFHLPKTGFHMEKENPFSLLFCGRGEIESAGSYLFFNRGNVVQNLIHALKYKGRKDAGVYLGNQYGKDLKTSSLFSPIDYIIPVPLHREKLISRGFNQSEQFALGLSSSMGLPVEIHALIRQKKSETQTKKTRFLRWQNVEDIFSLSGHHSLEGSHVLLVDDVVTTGATLEACIKTLADIHGIRISLATIAIAMN